MCRSHVLEPSFPPHELTHRHYALPAFSRILGGLETSYGSLSFDMVSTNIETWWIAVKTAALLCGAYLAWLMAFERWFEPILRRLTGSIARRLVVWVPAGRGFRIWG